MQGNHGVRSFINPVVFATFLLAAASASAEPVKEGLMEREREKPVDFRAGAAFGGAPFLGGSFGGLVRETTADWSGTAYARVGLPRISPRSLELYTVFARGYGLHVRNDDFHIGRVRLHLFDLGVFWNAHEPVTAARVPRSLDLSLGLGAEMEITRRVSLTFDWRTFMPLNVFSVLTKNGDYSRLIGEEVLKGGQAWLGASYRF